MIILLMILAGILLWRQEKNKITVISAVLPKEYQKTEKEWIAGMKECIFFLWISILFRNDRGHDFFFQCNPLIQIFFFFKEEM